MKNPIKKTLAIFSMVAFLCISFNGIMVRADDKLNQTAVTTGSNQSATDNGNTTEKNNSTSTNESKGNAKTNTVDTNSNISKQNLSDPSKSEVKDSQTNKEQVIIPGWQKKDGKLYYVTKDGIVKNTGWFKESDINPKEKSDTNLKEKNEKEYYLDKDHAATIEWEKINNSWYYFDEAGVKQVGWKEVDGYWYHLDNSGIMEKGWIKIEGKKYYLNSEGKMVVRKQYIDDKWYFFKTDGSLQTGFYRDNDKLYYSTSDGIMVVNGWIIANNNKYYIEADSSVAIGNAIIDNVEEKFDSYGKYIGNEVMEDHLFIKYLNVGNADCEFIRLPNGETALIDTGDPKTSDKVVNFLKEQNLKKENGKEVIDYIIITHGHSDHIGGLASILNNFKVNKIYIPDIAKMKDWYSNLKVTTEDSEEIEYMKTDYLVYQDAVKALKDKNMDFTDTKKGEFIDKENILQFVQADKDFGPIGAKISANYWGINNNSAVVYLNYGNLKALFTADIEWTAERDFLNSDLLDGNKIDVLKIPHHGRDTSSTSDFIEYLKPSIGIVSRAKEGIEKNDAYISLTVNAVNLYETSEKDGVSIAATKDNWTIQK